MKNSTVRADRPPVSAVPDIRFSQIPFGPSIRRHRPAVVKTYAVVIQSSWVEPDGRRITRSTDRHLAELSASDPKTIATHLAELEKAGVITIQREGRRIIVVHDQAVGVGDWRINLFDDHPAWAVSPLAFKVHLGLRKFAGKKTSCNPTDRTLAEFLNMSPDSVKRGMAELRKCMGIVTTCSPFDRDRRTKARTIHLARAERWIITKPVDPTPDPKSASLNTSMGADLEFDDRPERVDRTRKSAPEQSEICTPTIGNLHLNNSKSAPIEVLIEDENKPKPNPNPLPTELSGQSESEPERVEVVVGSGSVPPQGADPKADPADELIGRLAKEFDKSELNVSGKIHFKRAIREIFASHGPIAASWVEDALSVRDSPEIKDLGKVAIANLRKWAKLTPEERAEAPDETKAERTARKDHERKIRFAAMREKEQKTDSLAEPPKVVRSKFDGQERVQRADGTWANKALPPQNGSGTLAHVILAERGQRPSLPPSHIPNLMPRRVKSQNENTLTGYFNQIAELPLPGVQLKPFFDAINEVPTDLEPAAYAAALERILTEAVKAVPPPPPPVDPAELERRRRERAERERRERLNQVEAELERRRRERAERERRERLNQVEAQLAKEIDTRTKAFEKRELLRISRDCPGNLNDAVTAFRTVTLPAKRVEIEAAVRAEFAPKFAALAPTPPPTRKPPGPPPGPPATIPAMSSR